MNVTQETLDLMKGALSQSNDDITKSITTANGLAAYDLQAPAKNLYPVYCPLRNKIPRVGGGKGVATNWRTVKSILGSGFDSSGWIPEGQRSGRMSYSTPSIAANYVTIGEEDSVTFEAVNAGRTFEDLRATMALRLLQKMMLKEENMLLGGNASVALGTPAAPTVTSAASGGTIGAATYNVIVVALTQEGYFNSSLTAGVATTKTVTGADGATYVINGGSSNKSTAGSTGALTGSTNVISATVTAVNGAVAYAWYVGTAGNETLQAITTINSISLTALSTGNQNASAVTADSSTNATGFDGLLSTAFKSGSGAYVHTMATGTAGTGTPLTASGRGSVVEIDTMLQSMWDNYQLSATVLYVNSQELKNITTKVIGTGNAALIRYQANGTDGSDPFKLTAGGMISFYFNPFMPDGGAMIPVRIHPKVPPGTILAYCEELPIYYQNNEVANVAEVKTRQDYYQIDWPLRTRQYETGVYAEEVLAIYAPFAMAVLNNIANG